MEARRYAALTGPVLVAFPLQAHAHHAMDNVLPGTALEGLISGLAHPVIGLDHFVFVLAIGVACYCFGQRAAAVAGFIAAAVAGTVLHLYKASLPYPDAWVALSVLALGLLMLRAAPFLKGRAAPLFFALCGLAHGYAYGESIVGAEPTPLFAYLAGYTVVQVAVVMAGYALARYASRRAAPAVATTAAGAALSVAGTAFLVLSFAG